MVTKRKYLAHRINLCLVCEKPFRTSRSHAVFCSDKCRKRNSRAGQKKRQQTVTHVTLKQLDSLAEIHGFKEPAAGG
jgi:predicted nucleic acid-binding Zn ribbon protein